MLALGHGDARRNDRRSAQRATKSDRLVGRGGPSTTFADDQPSLGARRSPAHEIAWHEVIIAHREKTGRIVGTALVISVLAIIYLATRPREPSKDDSNLHLLPPPAAQTPNQ